MKDVAIDANLFGPMKFDEITDIDATTMGKPSVNLIEAAMFMPPSKQKFDMVVDRVPAQHTEIPEAPISPRRAALEEESRKLVADEEHRQAMLKIDPMWDYKQTLEYQIEQMNKQMEEIEGRAEFLDNELEEKNKEYEQAVSRHSKEVTDERKRIATEYIDKMDDYLEDRIEDRASTDAIAELLKANKALYGDIDKHLEKEEKTPKKEPEVVHIKTEQLKEQKKPATLRRKDATRTSQRKVRMGTNNTQINKQASRKRSAELTRNISSAFGDAQQAYKIVNRATRK